MHWNSQQLELMEKRFRATLINSLAGIKQVALLGTKSTGGSTNLAIFNSLIHIGAHPPLYGLLFRPDTVQRDSLKNILETKSYTINFVREEQWLQAHQTSAKYPTGVSEFQAIDFKEAYLFDHFAPFIDGASVQIGLELQERININSNGTILIIGRIQHISCASNLLSDDGFVHLEKANTLACAGLDGYYSTVFKGRLSYAKTDQLPMIIESHKK